MNKLYSKYIIKEKHNDYCYLLFYIGHKINKINKVLPKMDAGDKTQKRIEYLKKINDAVETLKLIQNHKYITNEVYNTQECVLKDIPLYLSFESNIEFINKKYYEICPNYVYYYQVGDIDFIIINHQESDIPSSSHIPSYMYNLYIYTTGGIEDFENLLTKAKVHYDKYIDSNQNNDTIVAYTYDDGYWEKTNNKPKRSLDNIYLPKKDKDRIIQMIDNFRSPRSKKRYKLLNKIYKLNILLEGIWGAGKTSLVHAIASKYDYPIYSISFNGDMSDVKYQRSIQDINDNSIIMIEDIDGLASTYRSEKQTITTGDSNNNISFSSILNTLDGIFSKNAAITFITTNYKSNLDEALIRPGRIDCSLHFDYAKQSEIRQMYERFVFVDELIDIDEITDKEEKDAKTKELNIRSSESSKEFYKEFQSLNIQVPLCYFEGYFWSYIGEPSECIKNVFEIKDTYNKSNVKQHNMLTS